MVKCFKMMIAAFLPSGLLSFLHFGKYMNEGQPQIAGKLSALREEATAKATQG